MSLRIIYIAFVPFSIGLFCRTYCQSWSPLSTGMNWQIRALYADTIENILYAGGGFVFAGGVEVDGVAKWNGINWDSLGTGVDGYDGQGNQNVTQNVLCITRFNGEIYAGGAFDSMGGILTKRIAKWDGIKWDSISSAPNTAVVGLYVYSNELYIMGSFSKVGDSTASKIAKWNGMKWSFFPVLDWEGGGFLIADAIYYKGELYVCGNFSGTVGPDMADIARWDGFNWKAVGQGMSGGLTHVNVFSIFRDTLYVGGYFWKTSGDPGNCIAKWDGNQWHDAGGGMNAQVFDLIVYKDELYAGGQFTNAGGIPVKYIAKWNGTEWCSIGSNFDNAIGSFAILNDTLYAGGGFKTIDGDTVNYVAKWTGGTYVDTCGVISGTAGQIISDNDFKIFPNPATRYITISGKFSSATFTLYDYTGREVLKKIVSENNKTISLTEMSPGLYLYHLCDSNGFFTSGKTILH